jgi:hypothetical protein
LPAAAAVAGGVGRAEVAQAEAVCGNEAHEGGDYEGDKSLHFGSKLI